MTDVGEERAAAMPARGSSRARGERALGLEGLGRLIEVLLERGDTVIGPVHRDGVIAYDPITSAAELPAGWGDEQAPGRYRTVRRPDAKRFGYAVGPHAWRRFLFPPEEVLFRTPGARDGEVLVELPTRSGLPTPDAGEGSPPPYPGPASAPTPPFAFVGVRPCELAGIAVADRVFLDGDHPDGAYARRRAASFVVAVNCGDPADTCFCPSLGTGPAAGPGAAYDLLLTEVVDGPGGADAHDFLVDAGSDAGERVLEALGPLVRVAGDDDRGRADAVVAAAADRITRRLDTDDLPAMLAATLEHPHWAEVAERCLGCTSCTLVCPTCFCSTVHDVTDLDGTAARVRSWSSCFSLDHAYVHGGPVRAGRASRYRQWLTHKLGTWHDQFGESGCVGCGRCLTWCPVGIDLTEEVDLLRVPMASESFGTAATPVAAPVAAPAATAAPDRIGGGHEHP